MVWRGGSDPRSLGAAGYALLLQIAHPTVAAGVSQFSGYQSDPLGRLLRSIDYLLLMVFGGPDAAVTTARTLRRMHTRIKGTAADGRRYHALEPEAWAWVHATLGDAALAGTQHFARSLAPAEREQFYREWRALGRLLAVGERDLPADWRGYREYFDRKVAERLEDSDTVQGFLSYLRRDVRCPLPRLDGPALASRLDRAPVSGSGGALVGDAGVRDAGQRRQNDVRMAAPAKLSPKWMWLRWASVGSTWRRRSPLPLRHTE